MEGYQKNLIHFSVPHFKNLAEDSAPVRDLVSFALQIETVREMYENLSVVQDCQ